MKTFIIAFLSLLFLLFFSSNTRKYGQVLHLILFRQNPARSLLYGSGISGRPVVPVCRFIYSVPKARCAVPQDMQVYERKQASCRKRHSARRHQCNDKSCDHCFSFLSFVASITAVNVSFADSSRRLRGRGILVLFVEPDDASIPLICPPFTCRLYSHPVFFKFCRRKMPFSARTKSDILWAEQRQQADKAKNT